VKLRSQEVSRHRKTPRSPRSRCAPLTAGALLACCISGQAWAQQAPDQTTLQPGTLPPIPQAPAAPPGLPVFGGETGPAREPSDVEQPTRLPPFFVQTSITSELTWSSNGNFATTGGSTGSATLSIIPSVIVHDEGGQYRLDGNFTLDAVASSGSTASGVQPDRILPRGNLDFNADLIQNWLYFDTGLRSARTTGDPFAITTIGPVSAYNEYTTTQYRIAPYILHELGSELTLSARSENSWSSTDEPAGFAPSSGYYGLQSAKLEHRPDSLGWGIEVLDSVSRFQDQTTDALKDDAARLSVNYSLEPFLVGLIAGYERASLSGVSVTHAIGGIRAEWRPTSRTDVTATVEDRYFGTGWNVKLGHRNEDFALSASLQRDVTTYPAVLNAQTGVGFVTTLMNSLLSSEFTNGTQRVAEVQSLLQSTGAPADLAGASLVASAQAIALNTASVNAVLLGKFNTLSFTVYRIRTVPFDLPGEVEVFTVPASYIDNVTSGITINLVHHLDKNWDVNTTLVQANTTGLGAASGTSSKQTSLLVQLADRLSPRTTAFVGVRYQVLDSTLVTNTNESAVFAGITHRF
jgi:uncharacterized protein (PEP-CTERM system associated)